MVGAHRVIDTVGPLLALAPVRKRRIDAVVIVDGTLVPTRDHQLAAPSKNYRYSTNVQITIDADTRLVIATGDPQPGNRNDCTVYRSSGIKDQLEDRPVMTDGGYQGKLIMYSLADSFIALPGGFGTLDELFEILTWREIGLHRKSVVMLNLAGYFDPLPSSGRQVSPSVRDRESR